ncbi:MAG TPA: iron uptake transporter permease EfeU [Gammaproteobacteria bacterium]|nr:iron uptake transporter permease EfeU [Gammaproteobacteria bacterium]
MLATLVIGLREGLEAALIVGIIAAFLRKNGKSLTAMWLGVVLAVVLSIAVGVALEQIEQALPQAKQEGMESVIGCVAVFFVTGMIMWMNAHARDMKRQLETEVAEALGRASTYALASMAFLAVLKEGFETSVFLLATFSAAQSAAWAATGAMVGLLLAVVIGWGVYAGGVRINLSRFFRITGAFLVLVAAGLVVTSLRTAHEAGWLNAGQQTVLDLSWLVAPGTIRSALITGVLGIPADPRLIEVIGWFAYLIPVSLLVFWPVSHRLRPRTAVRLQFSIAAVLAAAAVTLAFTYPAPQLHLPRRAPLVAANDAATLVGHAQLGVSSAHVAPALSVQFGDTPAARLSLAAARQQRVMHGGLPAIAWHLHAAGTPVHEKNSMLTLDDVVALNHGRIPIGLNPRRHPGPYQAAWTTRRTLDAWIADGHLLDASGHTTTLVVLSGSGLQTPRTLRVSDAQSTVARNWRVSPAYVAHAARALNILTIARTERTFWVVKLPIVLLLAAFLLAAYAFRNRNRLKRAGGNSNHSFTTTTDRAVNDRDNNRNNNRGPLHASN